MSDYVLSSPAFDDLVGIYLTGVDLFGVVHAKGYHAGLARTFDFRAEYPRAARLREELRPPVRVFRYKAHMVIYDLDDEDVVTILRVRHGREDWTSDA